MSAKAALKQAKLAFARGQHAEVVQHCKQALKADKNSYDAYLCALLAPACPRAVLAPLGWQTAAATAHRFLGKAAFLLGELDQAALAYTRATEITDGALPAWKGLVEVHTAAGDDAKAAPAYECLVRSVHALPRGPWAPWRSPRLSRARRRAAGAVGGPGAGGQAPRVPAGPHRRAAPAARLGAGGAAAAGGPGGCRAPGGLGAAAEAAGGRAGRTPAARVTASPCPLP